MNTEAMSAALDAIHDIAGWALLDPLLPGVTKKRLEMIQSIARYKMDVRAVSETPPVVAGGEQKYE